MGDAWIIFELKYPATVFKAFIAENCGDKASAPCKLEEVLAAHYVRLPIGPFDLEIPHSMLADKQAAAK